MAEMNRAARRRQMKLTKSARRGSISGAAAGAMMAAGLMATPAAAAVTTTYDIELSCDLADAADDADLLVTSLKNAMIDPPPAASAVVNFSLASSGDCVIDLAQTTIDESWIPLTGLVGGTDRNLTVNGPAADSGDSLTIMGDEQSDYPVVTFASDSGKKLSLNDISIMGQSVDTRSMAPTQPLVDVSGDDADLALDGVSLTNQRLADTATVAAAISDSATLGTMTINDSTVSGNRSGTRGAVLANNGDGLIVDNSTFQHNYALDSLGHGGAITIDTIASPLVQVVDSTFDDNTAGSDGGAIYSLYGSIDISSDSTFHANEATSGSAGAVYAGEGHVYITDSAFTDNIADVDGGAVVAMGNLSVTRGTFTSNEATNGNSGAILAANGGTVSGSTFGSNTAANDGGAIDAGFGDVDIDTSEFTSNTSSAGNGGAVYNVNAGSTLDRSTFEANSAQGAGGGALFAGGTISNSTFVDNEATQAGAVYSEGTIVTSTFWNNGTRDALGKSVYTDGLGGIFGSIVANDSADQKTTDADDLGANLVTNLPTGWTVDGDGLTATKSKQVTITDLNLQTLALNQTGPENTGVTRTVALGDGSVAIDYYTFTDTTPPAPSAVAVEGAWALPATDQRGVDRTLNDATDVGAYEHDAPPVAPVCETTTLGNIRFKADSARLTATSRAKLRVYAHQIADAGCTHITLNGHTSGKGNSAALERVRTKLAKARNAAVKKYLTARLTELSVTVTFETHVFQANDPLYSNSGKKAYLNRRVEVVMSLPADS